MNKKAIQEARDKVRKEAIDSDLARYGESYARIYLDDDGSTHMQHVQRNLVRPIFAIAPPSKSS